VVFKDKRKSIFINPIHVQFVEIVKKIDKHVDKGGLEQTSNERTTFKTFLKYGTKITLDDVSKFMGFKNKEF